MADDRIDRFCADNAERFVSDLLDALRIPSISADPAHAGDVRRNAALFAELAVAAGFTRAEVIETAGHPAVYAERIVDPALPTVLIYGHHDVQPVDPLDEWVSPPFEPEVRDGRLHARGAVDDKGQVVMHLRAVETQLAVHGEVPLNLKLILEGEEEIGSTHFEELVTVERDRLSCDAVVVSDTGILARDLPAICVGLRGLALVEVTVSGPALDLHSGVFGGAVQNPVEALARVLAGLKDAATGRVLVPGFYDRVHELDAGARAALAALPYDEDEFRVEAGGVSAVVGEHGYSVVERRWTRPTLEINGIWGGYQGPGSKTIVPARAGAKISCRLVPNQDPAETAALVAAFVETLGDAIPGVEVRAVAHAGGRPVLTDPDSPAVRAAVRAMTHVFQREPVFFREGGSIPPVEIFQRVLGVPVVLVGMGLPDDQIHAPNEKFELEMYQNGVRVLAHLWDEMATALAPPA